MHQYIARIEGGQGPLTDDRIDDLMDALAGYEPAFADGKSGTVVLTITVPAKTIHQAAAAAIKLAEPLLGAEPVAVEILSEAEADMRERHPRFEDLIGVDVAASILDVSTQRVRQMLDERKLTEHRVGMATVVLSRIETERVAKQIEGKRAVTKAIRTSAGDLAAIDTDELLDLRNTITAVRPAPQNASKAVTRLEVELGRRGAAVGAS